MGGIAPSAIGYKLGRSGRENARTKATRLLVEGRVSITYVGIEGEVRARVRGDSGLLREVEFDRAVGQWFCDCPARGRCSHVMAVQAVVLVNGAQEAQNES